MNFDDLKPGCLVRFTTKEYKWILWTKDEDGTHIPNWHLNPNEIFVVLTAATCHFHGKRFYQYDILLGGEKYVLKHLDNMEVLNENFKILKKPKNS